ncbi:MAG TPA: dihydrolipoyl dehydrogenase [Alcaligenaceae bacterium]|nr:dihydrolipoyl dehydrogenase [Alcaligenaceae bacterium]
MQKRQTDVVVIGAGTAGMTAYRAITRAGKKAILVEGDQYGTTCARVGCMPSKLLIAAAEAAHAAAHTAPFGVHIEGDIRIDGKAVMQRVKSERDRFVSFVLKDIESFSAEDKVFGYARFVDDHTVQVGDHTQITASSFVVATGSTPFSPKTLQGAGDRLIVNDDVFYWDDLPKSIVIIGAGVIGLELGQALSRLGVKVTILNRSDKLGGISDPMVREAAREAIGTEVDLIANAAVTGAELVDEQVLVSFDKEGSTHQIKADYVLSAAGRIPNIRHLGLENTSATLNDKGMPDFDKETLLIHNTSIFFAGDVNDQWPILHEAADDGFQAGKNAAQWPEIAPVKRRAPMGVVFTDPQIMKVGASYQDLDQDNTVIGEVNFANQGRARVMLKNKGCLRVYADKASGRFLGAEMAGPAAEHFAHLLAWCLQMNLTIEQMLAMPFYHPVLEEGLRTALRGARA